MKFRIFKQIKWMCPLFSILLPVMVICGAIISPPTWVESALSKQDYSFKILIGFSSKDVGSGDRESQTSSRSYILFPSFKTVEITKYSSFKLDRETNFQDRTEEKSEVTTEESIFTTYYVLLSYFAFLFGTWWYWIKPASRQKIDKEESA